MSNLAVVVEIYHRYMSYREELRVGGQTLFPDDQEGVGQVEAEEDDPAGRGGHVGPGEERGDEEAEHDGRHRVGHHEAEDHRRVRLGEDVSVLQNVETQVIKLSIDVYVLGASQICRGGSEK